MSGDVTIFLWLLKLGAVINLYFLANTFVLEAGSIDPHIVVPARILFAVSAYRCLFPNRYKDNVVFHDSPLSGTFPTRLLATFAEVAFIYLLSHVIRLLNVDGVGWVDALSWVMVAAVVISQFFVWGAILAERLQLYFYEEIGWAILFTANTIASAWLYATAEPLGRGEILLQLNLLFGFVYLPWQMIHLRALLRDAEAGGPAGGSRPALTGRVLASGLRRSVHERTRSTRAEAWGGLVGLTWMTAYWAVLIPPWVNHVVAVAATRPS